MRSSFIMVMTEQAHQMVLNKWHKN